MVHLCGFFFKLKKLHQWLVVLAKEIENQTQLINFLQTVEVISVKFPGEISEKQVLVSEINSNSVTFFKACFYGLGPVLPNHEEHVLREVIYEHGEEVFYLNGEIKTVCINLNPNEVKLRRVYRKTVNLEAVYSKKSFAGIKME